MECVTCENYLLRRQFSLAQNLSKQALLNIPVPTSPFINVTPALKLKSTQLVSLRPSVSESNPIVRLCVVWLQATAELHETITSTTTSTTMLKSDLEFVPKLIQLHFPSSSTLPYLASIVWLTFLAKIGELQLAKESILQFKCSTEGRLYAQAHWRAVVASLGQVPSSENLREAQSRYEHLIEVLVLDVLVPLEEDSNALRLIETDVGVTKERKQSLWQIVQGQWEENRIEDVGEGKGEDGNESIEKGRENESGGVEQDRSAVGKLAERRIRQQEEEQEQRRKEMVTVEEGLSREDIEIICGGVVGVVVCGLGVWMAWKKRTRLMERFESVGNFLR